MIKTPLPSHPVKPLPFPSLSSHLPILLPIVRARILKREPRRAFICACALGRVSTAGAEDHTPLFSTEEE